jgi:hypothetical protein
MLRTPSVWAAYEALHAIWGADFAGHVAVGDGAVIP